MDDHSSGTRRGRSGLRPTVDQRAERRREVQRASTDRYSSLIGILRGHASDGAGRLRDDPARWHPVMRQLLVATIVVVVLIIALYTIDEAWRQERIDTWSGPTGDVVSGQEVMACLPERTTPHSQLPTWMRYRDRVFARTDYLRALRASGAPGETGQHETGYRLDRMRVLLPGNRPADGPHDTILIAVDQAPVASVYEWAEACD
jgi:hypothetical protein